MDQGEPLRTGVLGDPDCLLRVQVWPVRAFLTGFQAAFGDQEVGVPGKPDGIFAPAGIGAEGNGARIEGDAVPVTGDRVDQRSALHKERDRMFAFGHFDEFDREGELIEGNGERLTDNGVERFRNTGGPADGEGVFEPELGQRVQPGNMVQVVMADKQERRFFLADVLVSLRDTEPGIKDDGVFFRLDEYRTGIPGEGIVPSIGSKKRDLHFQLMGWTQRKV